MAFVSMFGMGPIPTLAEGTSSLFVAVLTEDRQNMSGVPVSITGSAGSYSVTTDTSGRARIDVASGAYALTPTIQGYEGGDTQTVNAESREGYLVMFDLRLPRVRTDGPRRLTVSENEPTASDGEVGDIWIVV